MCRAILFGVGVRHEHLDEHLHVLICTKSRSNKVEVCLHCDRLKQRWWDTVLLVRTDIPAKKTHMYTLREQQ